MEGSSLNDVEPLSEQDVVDEALARDGQHYLAGWRLHAMTAALFLSLFIATLEVSIVSTSLVTITNALHAFGISSWIVVAYLLTYTGSLIIWAKVSDIFGRKSIICLALLVFIVFSGACGAAQSIIQLVIFRVFQGIGGSGVYSMVMVIVPEMVPKPKFAAYSSFVSMVFALSYLLGPVLGGVININGAWRWVFLLNVPCGAVALAFLLLVIPRAFPDHAVIERSKEKSPPKNMILRKLDFVGFLLLLAASVFLVTALEEAGTQYKWSSALVVILLVLAALSWLGVIGWSWFVDHKETSVEPVFTWRFLQNRVFMGALLNTIFSGVPFTVAVIEIPQRFQAVNALSPLQAGLRFLPFALSSPVGAGISSVFVSKLKVPPVVIVILGSILQTIGAALMSTLPASQIIIAENYGYQVILGFGLGLNIAGLMVLTPFVVEKRDLAVAMGAVTQFRIMGGALGLAIATNVLNTYVKSHLSASIAPQQVSTILSSAEEINVLDPAVRSTVRAIFGHGYNLQMKVLIGFGAAQIPASLLMWGNHVKMPE